MSYHFRFAIFVRDAEVCQVGGVVEDMEKATEQIREALHRVDWSWALQASGSLAETYRMDGDIRVTYRAQRMPQ